MDLRQLTTYLVLAGAGAGAVVTRFAPPQHAKRLAAAGDALMAAFADMEASLGSRWPLRALQVRT